MRATADGHIFVIPSGLETWTKQVMRGGKMDWLIEQCIQKATELQTQATEVLEESRANSAQAANISQVAKGWVELGRLVQSAQED
jgi:hypothetical protein